MTTMASQLGIVDEVTFGTPVTVTKFYEYNSESIELMQGRVESKGLRATRRVQRADRFEPFRRGAAGTVELDVPTKGFGYWLKHMMGTVASSAAVDSNYTHTGTIGSLLGDFFTLQVNRPFNPSGTAQAFTYHGCKVTGWELAMDLDGKLVCSLDIDAEDEDTTTGLATASYPSDARVFTFAGAALTIAATSVEVKNFRVSGSNGLNVNRRFLRSSSLKKEPVENEERSYEWEVEVEFESLTQYNRFRDGARASTLAAIVATFDGPIAHGGATLPRLTVTMPMCRFDKAPMNVSGPEALMQTLSGVALDDAGNDAISLAYRSTDVTP